MQTDGIKIDKHFLKNLGQYFMDGFGSRWYGSQQSPICVTVFTGLKLLTFQLSVLQFFAIW